MTYVRGWTAHYTNGLTISSDNRLPNELPQTGLQVWMLYFTDGTRRILEGNDRFFWLDNLSADGIFGQTDDPASEVLARYPGAYIIEGELLPDDAYREIRTRALKREEP